MLAVSCHSQLEDSACNCQLILTFPTERAPNGLVEQGHGEGDQAVFGAEDHPVLDQTVAERPKLLAGRFKAEAVSDKTWQAAA